MLEALGARLGRVLTVGLVEPLGDADTLSVALAETVDDEKVDGEGVVVVDTVPDADTESDAVPVAETVPESEGAVDAVASGLVEAEVLTCERRGGRIGERKGAKVCCQ